MKLPLNWLKEYIDYGNKSPQEIAEIFTLLGHEVERIEDPTKNLDKIVIGKVLKIEKHPNADKLRVAETKIGSKVYKIICGGSNLREGMTTVVALPGARVRWHGEGDLVELKETEIRGIKSVGMICASSEIGMETLFPSKEEREIIDLSHLNLKDGDPLAKALELGPILHLDITPNRADCLSVIGLARELGAALGIGTGSRQARTIYSSSAAKRSREGSIKIFVENKHRCPKYTVQVFTDVKVGESSWFIKSRLWAAGIRPINNLVDITNYVMLETGEPMHVFDADKLRHTDSSRITTDNSRIQIVVRNAKRGEKLKALDGKIYDLDETMLVVADAEKPIAIAGIMGGEETGVTAETKNVVFEAAIFDPVSVRKTSQKLYLRSESSARFERGIPWFYPELAQARAQELVDVSLRPKNKAENGHRLAIVSSSSPKSIFITQSVGAINEMLNVDLKGAEVAKLLTLLGFKVTQLRLPLSKGRKGGVRLRATVPPWRLDIKILEDLYEEVGRLYGINKLKNTLPHGELKPAQQNPLRKLTEAARDELRALGYDEVYTYSFYGRDTLEKDGTSPEREPHLQIDNPINPNQEFLRTNLTRNLLDAASRNARIFDEVKIFEVGKVFHLSQRHESRELHSNDSKFWLPHEETHLALIAMQKGASVEELYRKFKGDVVALIGKQVQHEFREAKNGLDIYFGNVWVGWMGLLDETRTNNWKIKDPCAIAEFNLDAVLGAPFHPLRYKPTSAFPPALRDLAFTVDEKVSYGEVQKLLHGIDSLVASIELFDVYRGKSLGENKKSFALHITLQSSEKTLSDQEIDAVLGRLESALRSKLGAEIRS